MCSMLSPKLKPAVTAFITPIARGALAVGLTPNAVSTIGAIGVVASALWFFPRGSLFWGTLAATLFVLSDLFDGTMARLTQSEGTRWGAFIDSTLDRVADSSLLIGLAIYLHREDDRALSLTLLALVISFLIPYIRAKAEALGIDCSVGIAERTERLILILVGMGLEGLGVPYVLSLSLWILVCLGLVTCYQRINVIRMQTR